jgi:putative endonuclease
VLVFCEVKSRSSASFGSSFEAVTSAKQRSLRRLAAHWLRTGRPGGVGSGLIRFDVVAVSCGPDGALELEVLQDAF